MRILSISTSLQFIQAKSRIPLHFRDRTVTLAVLGVLGAGLVPLSAFAQQTNTVPGNTSDQDVAVDQQAGAVSSNGKSQPVEDKGFSAKLGHSISADSNLFRVASGANPKSDTINSTTISLGFEKSISQQRFQLEVADIINRYSNFSYLNYNAVNYRGAWHWNPSRRWSVQVNADRSRFLAPFDNSLGGNQRNVGTTKTVGIAADGWLVGNWYLTLGASRVDHTSELGTIFQPDEKDRNADFGIKYLTDAGNSITAMRRSVKGDYVGQSVVSNVTGTSFTGTETSLSADWSVTPQSELKGQVGRRERTNNQIGQRDFSGPFGEIGYLWQPSIKVSVELTASRSADALLDPSFSYSQDDAYSLVPTWHITDKVTTYVRLQRLKYAYRGPVAGAVITVAREDTANNSEIGVSWAPVRSITAKAAFQRQHRTSNLIGNGYDDNLATVSGSWVFW